MSTEGTERAADFVPTDERSTSPLYSQTRKRQIASTLTMRVYGIPFADESRVEDHVTMMFCGFQAEGNEYRECTTRIWHIPSDKILASGVVEEDFSCNGDDVHFFDVPKDTCAIEEQYVAVSLAMMMRDTFAAQRAVPLPPSGVYAARVGEVAGSANVVMPPGPVIALRPGGPGPVRGPSVGIGGGGPYHTTWVWTKEENNSRYDPMSDDSVASVNYW